jgi:hypothetical protein
VLIKETKIYTKYNITLSLKEIFIDKTTHFLHIRREKQLVWIAKPFFHSFSPPFRGITIGNEKVTDENKIVNILANYFENHFKQPQYDNNNSEYLQAINHYKQIEYTSNIPLEQIIIK